MRKFLLAVKGSKHDFRACEVAALLARESNGQVVVFHVTGESDSNPEQEATVRKIVNIITENFAVECTLKEDHIVGDVGHTIVEEIKRGKYYYVLLGVREDKLLSDKYIGQTAQYVLDNAPCPVVVTRDK